MTDKTAITILNTIALVSLGFGMGWWLRSGVKESANTTNKGGQSLPTSSKPPTQSSPFIGRKRMGNWVLSRDRIGEVYYTANGKSPIQDWFSPIKKQS